MTIDIHKRLTDKIKIEVVNHQDFYATRVKVEEDSGELQTLTIFTSNEPTIEYSELSAERILEHATNI